MTDNICLFDLDGSLADYDHAMQQELHWLCNPAEPEIRKDLWSDDQPKYIKARMDLIKSIPGFWSGLMQIPMGMFAWEFARQAGFINHVLTKGPRSHPLAWAEKVEWVQQNLGSDVDIHIVSDKSMVYGKVLYDDYPDYMDAWLEHRPRGVGIMPITSYNKSYTHPRVLRYDGNNFDEIRAFLKKAKER